MVWCLIYVIFLALLMLKARNYSEKCRQQRIKDDMETVEALVTGEKDPQGEVILRTRGIYTRIGRK